MYCEMHIFSINHRLVVLHRKNKRTVDEERMDTMMATLKKEKEREAEMNKQVETNESTYLLFPVYRSWAMRLLLFERPI
jgi:hypothetical protein